MPETTPLSPRQQPKPVRHAELDASWGRFRRDLLALVKESLLSPDVMPEVQAVTKEAAAVLDGLAKRAREATASSKRRVEAREAKAARSRRTVARMASKGVLRAAQVLELLEAERARHKG
ncbi:hypothetical protein [Streptomyces sp. NPDC049744]|uniref:hypothetical protein n=1 Tax=Streptomyces sp. NPDC049744 TaxID=3154359 RepID=UPI00341CDFBF